MSVNTSAPTFAAGEVLTAAKLNAFVDGIQAAWTAYTPTLTEISVGNGSITGRYLRVGKTILLRVNFAAGATTTYTGNAPLVSVPVTSHAVGEQWLPFKVWTGAANFMGQFFIPASGTAGQIYVPQAGAQNGTIAGMTSGQPGPGTTGNFTIQGTYEAA